MDHTISLPVDTNRIECQLVGRSLIDGRLYMLVFSPEEHFWSLWSGHPLIPDSWAKCFKGQLTLPGQHSYINVTAAFHSNGREIGMVVSAVQPGYLPLARHTFKVFNLTTKMEHSWPLKCNCPWKIGHSSVGWILLVENQPMEYRLLKMDKSEARTELICECAADSGCYPYTRAIGENKLYSYVKGKGKLYVYDLATKYWQTFEDISLSAIYNLNGQIYSVENKTKHSFLSTVHLEGSSAHKRQISQSALPVRRFLITDQRPATLDEQFLYTLSSCTDGVLYLTTVSHSHAPSLRSLATAAVQKLCGESHVIKYKANARHVRNAMRRCAKEESDVKTRTVWSSGVTTEKFAKLTGYRNKTIFGYF